MNQIFLEERSREKVKDSLEEGMMSQEYYRNQPNRPKRFHHLVRTVADILGTIIHLLFSKKKRPTVSH